MSTQTRTLLANEVNIAGHSGAAAHDRARASTSKTAVSISSRARTDRQLEAMVVIATLILIVPAAIGWLTRWRWQPWPPGRDGYGSVLREAHLTAAAYVPIGFGGY